MENSEFHEKSTPRVMEKRKIVNFTHKNTFLVWETRMPPKAYKTNGILMIFAPKTAKMRNFTKIMKFHKILVFLQKVRIL